MSAARNWTWAAQPIAGGRAAIFDVDGVISDAWHRQHFLEGTSRDWKGFFEAGEHDPPIESVIGLMAALDPEVAVILLTARPHHVQSLTVEWLQNHDVRWDLLVMRVKAKQFVSSSEFKRNAVGDLRDTGFDIEFALDDHIENIEMYRAVDVPAIYIHSGYFD